MLVCGAVCGADSDFLDCITFSVILIFRIPVIPHSCHIGADFPFFLEICPYYTTSGFKIVLPLLIHAPVPALFLFLRRTPRDLRWTAFSPLTNHPRSAMNDFSLSHPQHFSPPSADMVDSSTMSRATQLANF